MNGAVRRSWVPWVVVLGALAIALLVPLLGFGRNEDPDSSLRSEEGSDTQPRLMVNERPPHAASTKHGADDSTGIVVRGAVQLVGARAQGAAAEPRIGFGILSDGLQVASHTQAPGRFELSIPRAAIPHRLELQVTCRGYRPAVLVLSGSDQDVGTIVLDPGASYGGRVLDKDGRPIAGVRVALHYRGPVASVPLGVSAPSSAQGRFGIFWAINAFPYPAVDHYELFASSAGGTFPVQAAAASGLSHEHDVVLGTPDTLRLRIVRERDGEAVHGAVVLWSAARASHVRVAPRAPQRHLSDQQGIVSPWWPMNVTLAEVSVQVGGEQPITFFVSRESMLHEGTLDLPLLEQPHEIRVECHGRSPADKLAHAHVDLLVSRSEPQRRDPTVFDEFVYAVGGRTAEDGSATWLFGAGGIRVGPPTWITARVVAEQERAGHRQETLRLTPAQCSAWTDGRPISLGLAGQPEEVLWIAPSREMVEQLGPPVDFVVWVPLREDLEQAVQGSLLDRAPLDLGAGARAWRVSGVTPLKELIENTPDAGAVPGRFDGMVRYAGGESRTFELERHEWAKAYDSRTPLVWAEDSAETEAKREHWFRAVDRAGEVRSGVSVTVVPAYTRYLAREYAMQHLSADPAGLVFLGHLSADLSYDVTFRDWGTGAAAFLSYTPRERRADVTDVVLAGAERLSVRVRWPDGTIPARVSGILSTSVNRGVERIQCRYDPATGTLTAAPCVLAMYQLVVIGHATTVLPGEFIPRTYRTSRRASLAHEGDVVLPSR